jgi:cytochrome oxidase Cu insertion factor (SCO1/SenC/PrrC family)
MARTLAALPFALALLAGCRAPALPVLGAVPDFSLTDRSGRTVTAGDLRGHVWIADFIFTRCPDICPALTHRMALLQEVLAAPPEPVRLVSISVDPEHDTPEVLDAYARRMGAREHWDFLTGPRDAVAALLRDGFKVAFASDGPATAPITHSDRFVLVDRDRRIRGYYHGNDADDVARLERDAAALRAERPT